MARTCSTSLVPMPNASAPNAPCVAVCESPHTTVMPGCVRPSCGPTTWTMPWSTLPSEKIGTPNSAQLLRSASTCVARHGVGDRLVDVLRRDVVVLGGEREVGTTHRATGRAQAVEGLGAGHLVGEVQVDVEQVGLALGSAHHVRVPDLLRQRACPWASVALLGRLLTRACRACRLSMVRRQYQDMDNSSGVGVLDKAALVLGALEAGPSTLAGLVPATGLARPTAHRLAVGPRAPPARGAATCRAASSSDRGSASSRPPPARTGCSPPRGRCSPRCATPPARARQLYRRQGDQRICVAAAERLSGLRDTVPGRHRAVDARRLGRPGAAGVGGARAHAPRPQGRAVQRHGARRRTPTRLGPERRRARGRRRLASPHRCAARAARVDRRGVGVRPDGAARPRRPDACTRRPSSPPRTGSPRPLRRNGGSVTPGPPRHDEGPSPR